MEINTFIPPHIDTGVLSTINFYIKPDNCTTQYYKVKDGTSATGVDTKGKVFDIEDLEETGRFVAQQNDVYLLDTTVIHAVWDMGDDVRRTQMDLTYRFEDASATDAFDLSKKDMSDSPVIRDKHGSTLNMPSAYRETGRVALCLQSRVYDFNTVKSMLGVM